MLLTRDTYPMIWLDSSARSSDLLFFTWQPASNGGLYIVQLCGISTPSGEITERLRGLVRGFAPFRLTKYLSSNPSGDRSSNLGD
jgi:hypothetical protein